MRLEGFRVGKGAYRRLVIWVWRGMGYLGAMADSVAHLEFTLRVLDRLEGERKLRAIPKALLESAWASEAQTEAVIDALLTATSVGKPGAYGHARQVGEWAARIGVHVANAPSPAFLRRCGVLADVDPWVLERLAEVREFASTVRAYQSMRIGAPVGDGPQRTAARIILVADEFDSLAMGADVTPPAEALRIMQRHATAEVRPFVSALLQAVKSARGGLVASA